MQNERIDRTTTKDAELELRPWDRQQRETRKAFDAFVIYRGLPENRRLQLVAEQLHCSGANIRRWAAKWEWQARARDWDNYQDELAQEATVRERRRMAERQARCGFEMQDLATRQLRRLMVLLEKGRTVRYMENGEWKERQEPVELSPAMIIKFIEAGAQLERTALGDPREDRPAKIEVIVDVADPPPDDKAALEEAIALQEAVLGRPKFSPN